MHYLEKLDRLVENGKLPKDVETILRNFYLSYCQALMDQYGDLLEQETLLLQFLEMVEKQINKPFTFSHYHKRITKPFDYHRFGLEMIRPLVQFDQSKVMGAQHIDKMCKQLEKKENVILFANHQIEPDPQAINLLLEKSHPKFAEKMIFVAGQRVITDPLAVPFSKGCNLLCIYSKKYIETPPEKKHEKLLHNKKTLQVMATLLQEGGTCIYVAPSGGRDRPNKNGELEVAPFDPQSIEFFYLLAKKSKKPTHFYPLSLMTYHLLPPPDDVEFELGEWRHPQCTPIHLAFDKEIEMEKFPGSEHTEKSVKRNARAEYIWEIVKKNYQKFEVL